MLVSNGSGFFDSVIYLRGKSTSRRASGHLNPSLSPPPSQQKNKTNSFFQLSRSLSVMLFVSQDRHHEKKSKHKRRSRSRDDFEKVSGDVRRVGGDCCQSGCQLNRFEALSFNGILISTQFFSQNVASVTIVRKGAPKADATETARIQEVINGDLTIDVTDTAENTTRRATKVVTGRERPRNVDAPPAPAPTRTYE